MGFSALAVPVLSYRDAFAQIKRFRRQLKATDGIYTSTELHATKFTSGRGQLGQKGSRGIRRNRRCEIFNEMLAMIAQLPNVSLMNAFRIGKPVEVREQLLERLLNRIQKSMEKSGSQAVLMFDEGGNRWITKLCRRLSVYNPIKSMQGSIQESV